jgi:hypothetical protein
LLHRGLSLPDHRAGVAHELPVERVHPRLHRFLSHLPAQLHDPEDPAGYAPRPVAQRHDALGHRRAEPLQRPGQHAHAIGQERAVGRIVDIGLDHGGVDTEPSAADDVPLVGDRHQARQQLLERRPVEDLGEPDQGLGIGDPLALDAAEGAVDEVGPDFALALVKAPVKEVLEHEHSQSHRGRRARAAPTLTQWTTPREGLHHHVDQTLDLQLGIDAPEDGVPKLLAVGQQHLDKAPLGVRDSNHGVSGGSEWLEPQGLWPASPDIGHDHHPIRRMESTKMCIRSSSGPAHPRLARLRGVSSAPQSN